MQAYGDNFIPAIPMKDDPIHTDANPFCPDDSCDCHEDDSLIAKVNEQYQAGLFTAQEATRFVGGKGL